MVDLSQNSLNFLSEILSQIKALHLAIHSNTKELQDREPEQMNVTKGPPEQEPLLPPSQSKSQSLSNASEPPDELNQRSVFFQNTAPPNATVGAPTIAADSCVVFANHLAGNALVHPTHPVASTEAHTSTELAGNVRGESGAEALLQINNEPHFSSFKLTFSPTSVHKQLLERYDRQEVYEKVWQMPIWKAAKLLDVRELTLSSACIRLHIPTPPPGYWSRQKEYRKSFSRPPLPTLPGSIHSPSAGQQVSGEPLRVSVRNMSRYDREKLYADVWNKPLNQLAMEYGASDSVLAHRCKILHIPTPPIDYWQRKARNLPVPERPSLEPVLVTEAPRSKTRNPSVSEEARPEDTADWHTGTEHKGNESTASGKVLTVEITRPIPKHFLNNYDREELYEMVWSMPLWQVAEVLGRKASSISKACVKLYIPIPPHGYWCRHEISRSSISRPPLPNLPSSLIPRPDPQQNHDGPLTVSALLMSRYDRVKIYKEVWTKPIAHLAREKGVSDTTLITRCKQLRIPTPGVDYWQRKAKNLPVPERPPLEPVVVIGYTSNTENWDRKKRFDRLHDFAKPRKESKRHPE